MTWLVAKASFLNRSAVGGLAAAAILLPNLDTHAQVSVNSTSSSWTGSWNFPSPTQKSVEIQQADLIRKSRAGFYSSFGPATNYVTNNNDNRSNYVEVNADGNADIDVQHQVGDDIGQNTNVVGSINTGSTTIDIRGQGNTVSAINSSQSEGCLNGSINTASSQSQAGGREALSVLGAVTAGLGTYDSSATVTAGSSQAECLAR